METRYLYTNLTLSQILALYDIKKCYEAKHYLNKILNIGPKYISLLGNKGNLLSEMRRIWVALQLYDKSD